MDFVLPKSRGNSLDSNRINSIFGNRHPIIQIRKWQSVNKFITIANKNQTNATEHVSATVILTIFFMVLTPYVMVYKLIQYSVFPIIRCQNTTCTVLKVGVGLMKIQKYQSLLYGKIRKRNCSYFTKKVISNLLRYIVIDGRSKHMKRIYRVTTHQNSF